MEMTEKEYKRSLLQNTMIFLSGGSILLVCQLIACIVFTVLEPGQMTMLYWFYAFTGLELACVLLAWSLLLNRYKMSLAAAAKGKQDAAEVAAPVAVASSAPVAIPAPVAKPAAPRARTTAPKVSKPAGSEAVAVAEPTQEKK